MNKKELLEKRELLQEELQNMLDNVSRETRSLTSEESKVYSEKENELKNIINEIRTLEKEEVQEERKGENKPMEKRELNQAYVKGLATGNMDEFRRLVSGASASAESGFTNLAAANTIPTTLMSDIIEKINEVSNVVADIPKVQATGDVTFFVEKEDVLARMLLENEDCAEENPAAFDTVTLKDKRIGSLITVTKNLLNNSPIIAEGYLVDKLATRIARRLEQQVFLADGTGANMSKGLLVSVPAGNKVTTAATLQITLDDILPMVTALKPQFLNGAKFYMNRNTFGEIAKLKYADGRYAAVLDVVNGKPQYTLFGYPIEITEVLADKNAIGNMPVVFANMKEAMKIKIGENAQIDVLREKFATRGAVGLNASFYGDCAVVNNEAYKVLVIK